MRGVRCIEAVESRLSGCVPFRDVKSLPRVCAVYVAFCDPYVLYVGQSASLDKRWKSHHMRQYLRHMPDAFVAYEVVFQDSLLAAEREWIQILRPRLNGSHCYSPENVLAELKAREERWAAWREQWERRKASRRAGAPC